MGVLDVNDGGELSGNGMILLADAVSAGTQLFNLDGTLTAHSTAAGDLLSLAFATLTINVSTATASLTSMATTASARSTSSATTR